MPDEAAVIDVSDNSGVVTTGVMEGAGSDVEVAMEEVGVGGSVCDGAAATLESDSLRGGIGDVSLDVV